MLVGKANSIPSHKSLWDYSANKYHEKFPSELILNLEFLSTASN